MKVCKFGGTSMANADTILKVIDAINGDKDRHYIVVSAPGRRTKEDIKVTDALYKCYDEYLEKGNCDESFTVIEKRFQDIKDGLKIDIDLDSELKVIKETIEKSKTKDYAASRGEYLSARLLAACIGYTFVDTQDLIKFNERGELQLDYSLDLLKSKLKNIKYAVLPGFYGSDQDGNVKTFSRGGSDITGAIVARAMDADVYENWTDVDGFLMADPRIVDDPANISFLSYKELRELSYMGAEVLHPESIFPVRSAGIPINIKNTFNPSHPGTMIVPDKKLPKDGKVITGIAGRKGLTIINIEKDMMNSEIGFGRKVLSILECEGISFEHMPSGIDTLSIVITDENLQGKLQKVITKIRESVNADNVDIHSGLSLIATVGHNMASRHGTASTLFTALADAHINIRMIDQGSSELNIIVGVDTFDYNKAINAIYHAFN
ncbi:MAG: aspartate kinase [Clostridia bacterium]|nr:aspartate kinase [Clostridia bacterium]